MDDFLAEVDEVMRQERMEKFWKENGTFIIALIVVTIVATGALSFYRSWNANVKARQTSEVFSLMGDPAFPENIDQADLELRGGLKGIVLLNAAGAHMQDNQPEEALGLYRQAGTDNAVPEDLRQLAILMTVRLEAAAPDSNAQNLVGRLRPVWEDGKSPWRYHARLEAATIYAEKLQNYGEAQTQLNAILNDKEAEMLPPSLLERARALKTLYAMRAQDSAATQGEQ